jgi:hypothetical protein
MTRHPANPSAPEWSAFSSPCASLSVTSKANRFSEQTCYLHEHASYYGKAQLERLHGWGLVSRRDSCYYANEHLLTSLAGMPATTGSDAYSIKLLMTCPP